MIKIDGDLKNDPNNIISTWIALEALSPQTFNKPEELANNDRQCVTTLSENYLPWNQNDKTRQNYKLYYLIILGTIPLKYATEELIKVFGKNEENNLKTSGNAILAALLVDEKGCLLKEKSIGVSSFAWSLPQVLNKKLNKLANWSATEIETIDQLNNILNQANNNGDITPLNYLILEQAWKWLLNKFDLPDKYVKKPEHVIRVYQCYKSKKPPELPLLNSFFLHDLALVDRLLKKQESMPIALSYYLGKLNHNESIDILNNTKDLECALAPNLISTARWPSVAGHPLVTLQQAAVNLVRKQLAEKEGLVAVNGPPGTGKTTLLRDIIVASVIDRVTAMCHFDDPNMAFTKTGKNKFVGKGFFHLYTLSENLKGHEIVVASNNNKAVENISMELPALKAIDSSYAEKINYFKSISDKLFNSRKSLFDNPETSDETSEKIETWGLIAAVLGNSTNKSAFQKTFWNDKENSFQTYLKAVKGDNLTIEETSKDGKITRRQPAIILQENPPTSFELALREWKLAKSKFTHLKQEIELQLHDLSVIRQQWHSLLKVTLDIKKQNNLIAQLNQKYDLLSIEVKNSQTTISESEKQKGQKDLELGLHKTMHPGFFAKLFRCQKWKLWLSEWQVKQQWQQSFNKEIENILAEQAKLLQSQQDLQTEINQQKQKLSALIKHKQQLDNIIKTAKLKYGDKIVDHAYLSDEHEKLHQRSPWITEELHKKREELFIAGLDVQRAFIGCAAKQYLHNLNFFIDLLNNELSTEYNEYLPDIWATFFSVIPVISTTFASVSSMFKTLSQETIGWLLIDEAGQALPQASVGAIFRAKRVVVVGDPLQIPPIVSLPQELNHEICTYFNVNESRWTAPSASTQTLSDSASLYQSQYENTEENSKVGLPLLVHRRCQNPMFTISNLVAYQGKMVYAVPQKPLDEITSLLGTSCWFNIDGEAHSKWSPEEGAFALKLLTKIVSAVRPPPDIFIITPFRDVAFSFKRMLKNNKSFFNLLNMLDDRLINTWLDNNIGTVHTFQGREAEIVIFLLGAPNSNQIGARKWATNSPNIINVAVSRAKRYLYVIGSYGAWANIGYARDLANNLPCKNNIGIDDTITPDNSIVHEENSTNDEKVQTNQKSEPQSVYFATVETSEIAHEEKVITNRDESNNQEEDNNAIREVKKCANCNKLLALSCFYPAKKYADGWSIWCKDCISKLKSSRRSKSKKYNT